MKLKATIISVIAILLCVATIFGLSGCGSSKTPAPSPTPPSSPTPSPPPSTPEPTQTPVTLVPYDGIVHHLFFHEAIAYPELAFPNRTDAFDLDNYMNTVHEFIMVLKGLHERNYILVDMREVWTEFLGDDGQRKMRRNTLMLPEGKIPIVLSFDDLTFHLEPYNAFMHRYIIGHDGEVWAEGIDPSGNPIITQDLTAITILDKFIRENPDFSHNGAKGLIAQTGLNGLLGYATQTNRNDTSDAFRLSRMQEIARVRPVVKRLNETGWYWASHSWGHIRFENASLESIKTDAERWNNEVASIIGDTTIMVYAHGSRLDGKDGGDAFRKTAGPALSYYVNDLGFRMFASVGREPFSRIRTDVPAVVMDRMNVDGIALRALQRRVDDRDRLMTDYTIYYDVTQVFDPLRPDKGVKWD
ncbi:MAG: hydrolase [Oscillospiraceae bacterium]|nr:hydrolase [Oscillospiraceae bacterium]